MTLWTDDLSVTIFPKMTTNAQYCYTLASLSVLLFWGARVKGPRLSGPEERSWRSFTWH